MLCVRSKLFPGYNISRKCKTVELLDAMYLQRSGSLTENANKYLKTEHLMTPTAVFCNPLISGFYASHLFGMRRKTVEEARLLNLIVAIISPSLSQTHRNTRTPTFNLSTILLLLCAALSVALLFINIGSVQRSHSFSFDISISRHSFPWRQ